MFEYSIYREYEEERKKRLEERTKMVLEKPQKKHHVWEYWIPIYGAFKAYLNRATHYDEAGGWKGSWFSADGDVDIPLYYKKIDDNMIDSLFGLRKGIESTENFLSRVFFPTKIKSKKNTEKDEGDITGKELLNTGIAVISWVSYQGVAFYGAFQALLAKNEAIYKTLEGLLSK